ncbi:MAG: hypothetical protein AB1668_05195 [Nanoarchaeota archaeon]
MQEKHIVKISFIAMLIGLCFLFFYAEELDFSAIESIDSIPPDENVHIKGLVKKVSISEKAVFLEVEGEKLITTNIIYFPEENILLHEGDYVEITGLVEEYKGKKEVVASKVVLK